jgi:uncharacterized protein YaaQ
MKLVTAIVHNEDAGTLVDALLEREFRSTRLHSSGGFLKQGNATILVGVEDDQVDAVLELISANCHARRQFVNPMPPILHALPGRGRGRRRHRVRAPGRALRAPLGRCLRLPGWRP